MKQTLFAGVLISLVAPIPSSLAATAGPAEEPPPIVAEDTAPETVAEPTGEASPGDGYVYETVVIGSRAPQRQFESNRSIAAMTHERLEDVQPRSTPEALAELPGVHLQQTNRGAGAPIIRGLVGPQNLILVDGIPLNTSTFRVGPNQYLALVDPWSIYRAEVVRGPSSVTYGNGAMGGVMQIFTVKPKTSNDGLALGGEGAATYSSADQTRGLALRLNPRAEKVAATVAGHVSWFDTLRAGGGRRQPLSDYSVAYWQAKVLVQPVPALAVTGAYLGAMLRDTGRTDSAGKGDIRFYDNDDHLAYLALTWRGTAVVRGATARLYYHRLTERMDRFSCAVTDSVVDDLAACFSLDEDTLTTKRTHDDSVDVVGGDLEAELAMPDGRLRLFGGLGHSLERIDDSRSTSASAASSFRVEPGRGNYDPDSRYLSLGAFLQADARFFDLGPRLGSLHLSGGGRFAYVAAAASAVPDFGRVRYADSGTIASVGLQLLSAESHNIYATLVQGFRPPNLQETTQLGDTGQKYSVPNPKLQPEKSNTLEVGAKIVRGGLQLEAAYFISRNPDAIVYQATSYAGQSAIGGKQVVQMVNANEGRFHGVEGSLAWRWWRLTFTASASRIEGQVQFADGSVVPAQRVPPLFGALAVRYEQEAPQLYVEAFVRGAAAQSRLHPEDAKDLRICEVKPYSGTLQDPCDGTPAWATVNLRGAWHLDERFGILLSLANLTDERYRLHGSGFDAPGFDARFTLQARW